MPRKSERPQLKLGEVEREKLSKLSQSGTAQLREVERASILLLYAEGMTISSIQRELKVSSPTIYKCIGKAVAASAEIGLKNKFHSPNQPIIWEEAKTWVLNLACTKPKDHGYAAELWTLTHLAKHTRGHAPAAGHDCLSQAGKATIYRILKAHPVQAYKMKYYLEKRDEEFEEKMRKLLIVYREVNLQNTQNTAKETDNKIITFSLNEKPGIQAIKNIDNYDPAIWTIRITFDNHSAHISNETMNYLSSRPNRFVYVLTPKHGSWLNLIEPSLRRFPERF